MGYTDEQKRAIARSIKSGQSSAYSTNGPTNNDSNAQNTGGFGGYRPSEKVTGALDAIATGSYIKNPYTYDPNETNPFYGSGAKEEAAAWDADRAEQIRKSQEWEDSWKGYEGSEGLKYLADQGFSDDDMNYIWAQMYTDPRFENIVANNTDAVGKVVPLEEAYRRFAYGDAMGPDVDGNALGGYLKELADNNKTPTEVEFENMTDEEKVYTKAREGYVNKYQNYYRAWQKEQENPNSKYYGADLTTYMKAALEGDPEFAEYKSSMEKFAPKEEMTEADNIMAALEAGTEEARRPKVQELETALGMAYTPEEQIEILRKLYELTGDKKYKVYEGV